AHILEHLRQDESRTADVPSPPRVSQPFRHHHHTAAGLHGVRMDVRRVGLGCPRVGRGDPPTGGSQAAPWRDHPAARWRRVRRRWGPPPHRGRAPGDHRGRAPCGLCLPPARGARPVIARRWRWLWWLAGLGGVGLALKFFVGFPWRVTFAALLDASPWLLALQVGVGLGLAVVVLLAWARGWAWLVAQLPAALGARLVVLGGMGSGGRLLVPTLLGLWNWATQWATYHLVLQATHVPVSL